MPPTKFSEGEKILCYQHSLIYDGKCLKIATAEDKEVTYLIHYSGWSKSWDEWVAENRIMKYNPENVAKQEEQRKAYLAKTPLTKAKRSKQKKSSSTAGSRTSTSIASTSSETSIASIFSVKQEQVSTPSSTQRSISSSFSTESNSEGQAFILDATKSESKVQVPTKGVAKQEQQRKAYRTKTPLTQAKKTKQQQSSSTLSSRTSTSSKASITSIYSVKQEQVSTPYSTRRSKSSSYSTESNSDGQAFILDATKSESKVQVPTKGVAKQEQQRKAYRTKTPLTQAKKTKQQQSSSTLSSRTSTSSKASNASIYSVKKEQVSTPYSTRRSKSSSYSTESNSDGQAFILDATKSESKVQAPTKFVAKQEQQRKAYRTKTPLTQAKKTKQQQSSSTLSSRTSTSSKASNASIYSVKQEQVSTPYSTRRSKSSSYSTESNSDGQAFILDSTKSESKVQVPTKFVAKQEQQRKAYRTKTPLTQAVKTKQQKSSLTLSSITSTSSEASIASIYSVKQEQVSTLSSTWRSISSSYSTESNSEGQASILDATESQSQVQVHTEVVAKQKEQRKAYHTKTPPTKAKTTKEQKSSSTIGSRTSTSGETSIASICSIKQEQVSTPSSTHHSIFGSCSTENNFEGQASILDATESEFEVHVPTEIKIKLPDELKLLLADDWHFITKKEKLVNLPAKLTVDEILNNYVAYKKSAKDNNAYKESAATEISNGIKLYFNAMLATKLLYKFERPQYKNILEQYTGTPMSKIYGARHLLRLFVKMGAMLGYTPMDDRSIQLLQTNMQYFFKYLIENSSTLFTLQDYGDPSLLQDLLSD